MAQKYKKFTHLEHILARPDTYVGSLNLDISNQWVISSQLESQGDRFVEKQTTHIGGLYKIYDEILVNALDQCSVDDLVDKISITVDITSGSINVTNTGQGVPVEKYESSDLWIPEVIFGELLTSSNYDDNENRTTGGRNGYGAKLANVFSKRFILETVCTHNNKKYIQEWSNNMTVKGNAKITKCTKNKGYTSITFYPDLPKFSMNSLTDNDIVALFERRAFDACACTPEKVKIYYNGKLLSYKSFEKYIDLYIGSKQDTQRVFEKSADNRWEIGISSSESYKQVSFVNGIHTSMGGSHVEYITSQVIKKMTDLLTAKHKTLKIKPQNIKDNLFVFVKATLVNPTFSSQTKNECTLRYRDFGSRFEISDAFIKKVMKLGFVEDMLSMIKHKETRELNKTDGRKTSVIRGIPKLEDANKAGTSQSKNCTLILTEGDSAKTFAISGLSIVGRNTYGVFPLKGKLLNVRDASVKQLANNEEINCLKQIMGLQVGKTYTNANIGDLRYGRILILTDADVDGSHIKGLLVNFIHHFWPSLLSISNFMTFMKTPILKAVKKQNKSIQHSFYTKSSYDEWLQGKNPDAWTIKYYKGLGTSTAAEAREYFKDFDKNVVSFTMENDDTRSILLAFKKSLTNERKVWIQEGCASKSVENTKSVINYTEFINNELRLFSICDNERSIPNIMDGFKPSQRKVIHACRKRSGNNEIKVSQLSGFVSSETCYHHGEQSLMSTIINMAQTFVGSNNLNLLNPVGQFGSRLLGGKDAASPRYIFTNLVKEVDVLFNKDDDQILSFVEDDGQTVEPEFFVPLLPLVLINGTEGIGTGYSTNVPCFNPEEVKQNVIRCIRGEEPVEMTPFYKGFCGTIELSEDRGKFVTRGVCEIINKHIFKITELPIGKWTSDYKEFLDGLTESNAIKMYENNSSDSTVNFTVTLNADQTTSDIDIHKVFKLSSFVNTNNMHLFNIDGKLCNYQTPLDIIKEFTDKRLQFYTKRKDYLVRTLNDELAALSEKIRFMRMVMDDEIHVFKQSASAIRTQLRHHSFKDASFETLLGIKLYAFTNERIGELESKITEVSKNLSYYKDVSNSRLWLSDIKTIAI